MADWNQLPVIIVGALIALFIVALILVLIVPAFINTKITNITSSTEAKLDSFINEIRSRLGMLRQ